MIDPLSLIPVEKMKALPKHDLVALLEGEQAIRFKMQEELDRLKSAYKILEDEIVEINGKYIKIKHRMFAPSSEKSKGETSGKSNTVGKKGAGSGKKRRKSSKNLTEKYPNVPVVDQNISFAEVVVCPCCQANMSVSGMGEVTEYLDVTPRKYTIVRQKREKYRCQKCHGSLKTAPTPARIKPGSSYSDGLILDVSLSKYCDLIPIEHYASMAKRQGIDLPANSLIGLTHHLAKFTKSVYELLRAEVLALRVIYADETRHRMLEASETSGWYLWGFSNPYSCYFECHDTRAGSVASNLLLESDCQVLVSDVYSGYIKAVRKINEKRSENKTGKLIAAFCNSHSRRKFKEAEAVFPEDASYFLEKYKKIYKIEKGCKNISPRRRRKIRRKIYSIFSKMKFKAEKMIDSYSSKSDMTTALNYFLKNFEGLTVFVRNPHVAIDNNSQERLLRSPVIGRKTWLGTHSIRGAETAAILFSIVESCKLNKINPRKFFDDLIKDLHDGKPGYTPRTYKYEQQKKQSGFIIRSPHKSQNGSLAP